MITMEVEFEGHPLAVERAIAAATYRNLTHAAASIRKTAVRMVERRPEGVHSRPGDPPFTHRGNHFRRAIRFHVDESQQDAVIGFAASIIGDVGALHEFGGIRGSVRYPERPTLGPALELSIPRIGPGWEHSIGPV